MHNGSTNQPAGPEAHPRRGTVTIRVDGRAVTVATVDGEARVGDIIRAAGGSPGRDLLGLPGEKGLLFRAGQTIRVPDGCELSLSTGGLVLAA